MRVFIDCDGVLTDGRLHIDHRGEKMFKSFHTRDVRAIRELVFHGWEVILVSADDWDGLEHFASKVGAACLYARDKGSLGQADVAVGDDAWDVPMLRKAVRAFAPNDCDPSVRDVEGITILLTKGGEGIVAELLIHLIP